ncbi:MAG: hypothetical protein K9I25_02475 [Crocinitomicaceae bacterium]|jgi:hypothetical protein|nr:hypothetical protein [Crocinitomicaceae bacterium]
MKNKHLNTKTTYYWFSIFALCFLCFQVVSYYIRPHYSGESAIISYFLGIAPNFFPAIGIPALFVVFMMQLKSDNQWLNKKRFITANVITIIGLVGWEFIQTTSKKLHFDWNDILWTFIGAAIFHVIWGLTPERLKVVDPTIQSQG